MDMVGLAIFWGVIGALCGMVIIIQHDDKRVKALNQMLEAQTKRSEEMSKELIALSMKIDEIKTIVE
jgi:hypothetical protein